MAINTTQPTTGWGHHYYYNLDWQILEDREVNDWDVEQSIDQYIWSLRYVDAPLACLHDGNADGDVDDYYPTDWRRYYLTDAQHNVTTTIRVDDWNDIASDGVVRNVYEAYGGVARFNEAWGGNNVEAFFDSPLYNGYFYDTETSLYQVRNRFYDTGLATFLNRDPIGYNGSDTNLYRYCGNEPINGIDPSGLSNLWNAFSWFDSNPATTWGDFLNPLSSENLEFAKTMPGAYLSTAWHGEQASSLTGYSDSLTDSLNPFGGGTSFGPQYGQHGAYQGGQAVGIGTGIAMNTVLMFSGVRGVVTGIQAVRSAGGFIEIISVARAGGGSILAYAGPSGALIELTPALATNLGISTVAFANLKSAADLQSYGGPGGGHHVPAKSAFRGAKSYSAKKALAIPNAELERLGVSHNLVTGAQRTLYRAFAKTGKKLTWSAIGKIETQALVDSNMNPAQAAATVRKAIKALKQAGVPSPTRIPWGG